MRLTPEEREREDEQNDHREVVTQTGRVCVQTDRGLLRTARERIQQLLRGIQRPDKARDEDGFAVDVNDGGETGPVGETPARLLFKHFTRYQQTLDFLSVKLRGERGQRSSTLSWELFFSFLLMNLSIMLLILDTVHYCLGLVRFFECF